MSHSFEFNHAALAQLQDQIGAAMREIQVEAQSAFDEVFRAHAHGDVDSVRTALLDRLRPLGGDIAGADVDGYVQAIAAGIRIEVRLDGSVGP